MAIVIKCDCGRGLKLKDSMAGKKGKCPYCGTVLVVPIVSRQRSAKVTGLDVALDEVVAVVRRDDPVVRLLTAIRRSRHREIVESAAEALGKIGDPRVVDALIGTLKSKGMCWRAAIALGHLRDVRAVEPLITVLNKKGASEAVIEALGRIGDARAVEPLISKLRAGSAAAPYAAEALGKIGDGRAVIPLLCFRAHAVDGRTTAEEALMRMGARTVSELRVALDHRDKEVSMYAIEVLTQTGGIQAVGPLIDALQLSHLTPDAAVALGKIGDAQAVEPLIAVLNRKDAAARRAVAYAAEALGKIGDARAVEPLIAALSRGHRLAIVEALGQLGDPRSFTPLLDIIKPISRQVEFESMESVPAFYALCALQTMLPSVITKLHDHELIAASNIQDVRAHIRTTIHKPGYRYDGYYYEVEPDVVDELASVDCSRLRAAAAAELRRRSH